MKPTLLVLAAGMGSRYGGLKQMDGLGPNGETIIDYSIYDAVEAGFGKVVYIVREYFKEQMEKHVKEKYGNVKCIDGEPLEFQFVTQELDKIPSQFTLNPERVKPWGTAHAVLMGAEAINEPFAVINGDDYYGKESFKVLGDWLRAHEGKTGEYALVGFELDNTLSESGGVSRGIGTSGEGGYLADVVEHHKMAKAEDGRIYGATFVDHSTRCAFKCSELGSFSLDSIIKAERDGQWSKPVQPHHEQQDDQELNLVGAALAAVGKSNSKSQEKDMKDDPKKKRRMKR